MNTAKTLAAALAATALATGAFAQGSLTPPGAPAPAMKTLGQVEPRMPISSLPYTIGQPGSYYLSKNLALAGAGDGITIAADNVTLDLMGFSLTGGGSSGYGILSQSKNLVVKNGQLRGWGENGIGLAGATGAVLKDLCSADNGRNGFHVGANALVGDCVATGNSDGGFRSEAGSNRFVRCRSQGNYFGFHLSAAANQIKECEALGCFIGIYASSNSVVEGNTVIGNGDVGIKLTGTGSHIANNIVKGNGDNYDLATGNQLNILLCEIPETLDWPCSVKLAGTLACTQAGTNGITVAANDVAIDLDGHALVGPGASSGHGIHQDAYRNLTVKNGKVVHWEGTFSCGIQAGGTAILSGLQASTNYDGIIAWSGSTVSGCTARDNTGTGIYAAYGSTVSGCTARDNTGIGIYAAYGSTVSDCSASYNTGIGIHAYSCCTVSGCTAHYNGRDGIYAGGSTVSSCSVYLNTGDGIEVDSGSHVANCICIGNGCDGDGAGIHATWNDNRIEGNTVTGNDRGIDVDYPGNFIVKNTASGNTGSNYSITGTQTIGPIITATGTITSENPWANFSF